MKSVGDSGSELGKHVKPQLENLAREMGVIWDRLKTLIDKRINTSTRDGIHTAVSRLLYISKGAALKSKTKSIPYTIKS